MQEFRGKVAVVTGAGSGIGRALAQKIAELATTGKLAFFEELKASIEPGLVEMLQIPGLGPKKIIALHERLGIASVASLLQACEAGKVAELAGFGEKSQAKILTGIRNREAYGKRRLWWDAWEIAAPIVEGLRALPGVNRAEAAGSLRRGLETVGDLDFLVAAAEPGPVVAWFTALPGVKEVTASGDTKASVRFESGLQAEIHVGRREHQGYQSAQDQCAQAQLRACSGNGLIENHVRRSPRAVMAFGSLPD